LFLAAIKGINRLQTAKPPLAPPALSKVQLLTDIRNALKLGEFGLGHCGDAKSR
jgi:hypothetical protein